MSFAAFSLAIASAVLHAAWNLKARQVRGKLETLWLGLWIAAAAAFVVAAAQRASLTSLGFRYILLSGGFHSLYFCFLAKAYRDGHLSRVYPLARGLCVAGLAAISVCLMREQTSLIGIGGSLAVSISVLALALRNQEDQNAFLAPGIAPGIVAGTALIGCYLIDRVGIRLINPATYLCGAFTISACGLAPVALPRFRANEWSLEGLRYSAWIGMGSLVSYALMLAALKQGSVAYVSAVRESSVGVGATLGVLVLNEPFTIRKAAAVAGIIAGAILIKLS